MINPHYDHDSDYHDGNPAEADVKAWLGIWKSVEEVPTRYRLQQYSDIIDAQDAWTSFLDENGQDWGEHTRKYVYGKAWREWGEYCDNRNIHPVCADPSDFEGHLAIQQESINTNQTLYDARFRPLHRFWEWMRYHVDYPVRYNPGLMAVLLGGATLDAWNTRVSERLWNQRLREQEKLESDD